MFALFDKIRLTCSRRGDSDRLKFCILCKNYAFLKNIELLYSVFWAKIKPSRYPTVRLIISPSFSWPQSFWIAKPLSKMPDVLSVFLILMSEKAIYM